MAAVVVVDGAIPLTGKYVCSVHGVFNFGLTTRAPLIVAKHTPL